MAKKVSDELLLESLLVNGGVSGAAAALKITRNAIYKRLQDPVFRAQYDSAQGTIVSTATAAMAATLQEAVGALVDVMNGYETPASVKVSAADSLLRHGLRYIETSNILKRLDALEKKQAESDNNSLFNFNL